MNAPWKPAGATQRDPFVAYVCDDTTAETIRPIATELGWSPDKVYKGGLRNAIQSLSVSASPLILFVDLAESGDPLNDINALAEVCEPGTVVIASGQVNDVRLYRDLVASGIQDYLLKPLHPDMLREAFSHAYAMLNAPKTADVSVDRQHCATAVIGVRAGSVHRPSRPRSHGCCPTNMADPPRCSISTSISAPGRWRSISSPGVA